MGDITPRQPCRITLVIASLSAGGAERVISIMANYWAEKGHQVSLITLDSAATDFFKLHPDVSRISLDAMASSSNPLQAVRNNIDRIIRLRRAIASSSPDAVISFIEKVNILVLLATRGLGLRVIVSERTDPASHNIGRWWSRLRRMTYPWAQAVVGQSGTVCRWLEQFVDKNRLHVIPNPVQRVPGGEDALVGLRECAGGLDSSAKIIIAMGRLGEEKGFDLLITAFAKIAPIHTDWHVVILGEGEQRSQLLQRAQGLELQDRVHLPGRVANPLPLLRQAQLFVLPSRFEGFPNALCEAMACGLPVISFDCPSGPREIIRDGIDGMLVPPEDVNGLADTMSRLMHDDAERKRLAERAPDVTERFSLNRIMSKWETFLGC